MVLSHRCWNCSSRRLAGVVGCIGMSGLFSGNGAPVNLLLNITAMVLRRLCSSYFFGSNFMLQLHCKSSNHSIVFCAAWEARQDSSVDVARAAASSHLIASLFRGEG